MAKKTMIEQLKEVNNNTKKMFNKIKNKEDNVKKDEVPDIMAKLKKSLEEDKKKKEGNVKKNVKVVEPEKEVKKAPKKVIKRVRAPKPYEGLQPGTKEWMTVWKEHPELQGEMLHYKSGHLSKKEERVMNEKKEEKKNEHDQVEQFLKNKIEKSLKKHKGKLGKVAKELEMTKEILKRNMEKLGIKGGKGEAAEIIDDDNDPKPTKPIRKEERKMKIVPKKPVKQVKKVVKVQKEEVVDTVGKAFGSDGRTLDNYAIDLPEELQRHARPIIKWVLKNVSKSPYLLEIDTRTGTLKVYNVHSRKTASGRVAVLTAKKQGERVLATYRSNKNSRHVDDED